jgi:hypothetical protein
MEGDEDEASECFTMETNGLEGEGKDIKSNAQLSHGDPL